MLISEEGEGKIVEGRSETRSGEEYLSRWQARALHVIMPYWIMYREGEERKIKKHGGYTRRCYDYRGQQKFQKFISRCYATRIAFLQFISFESRNCSELKQSITMENRGDKSRVLSFQTIVSLSSPSPRYNNFHQF